MDINTDNFWDELPNLLAIIACSDYIAIDFEMTGVQVRDSLSGKGSAITLEQVYSRVRAAANTFEALQLGVTCIRWNGSKPLLFLTWLCLLD